jgi:DNA-binding NarL/FixJ family response regulator
MRTGIIVFEDSPAFRKDLEDLICSQEQYTFLGAFENAADVVRHVRECSPDVILMDIEMPVMDGIAGVRAVRGAGMKLPIIMLTAFDDSNNVFDAICAGASGYLLKGTPPQRIFSGIEEVLQGGAPMSPAIAAKAIQLLASQNRKSGEGYELTPKESETLRLLATGCSYKLIADELGVTRETIKTHIRNIYVKLQVHSATEAVSKAIKERLI